MLHLQQDVFKVYVRLENVSLELVNSNHCLRPTSFFVELWLRRSVALLSSAQVRQAQLRLMPLSKNRRSILFECLTGDLGSVEHGKTHTSLVIRM